MNIDEQTHFGTLDEQNPALGSLEDIAQLTDWEPRAG